MPVTGATTRNDYVATNGQNVFNYTFQILLRSDLKVLKNGTALTLSSDYTVAIIGQSGGSVTLNIPASAGDNISLLLAMPIDRTTEYQNAGDFLASDVNGDFDKAYVAMNQLQTDIRRAIGLLDRDPSVSLQLPLKAARANKFLKFDAGGNVSVSEGISSDTTSNVTVRQYGAVGDGTTDDSAAFTLAANAVNASGGGDLHIPASSGNYLIKNNVTVQSTVNLVFTGGKVEIPSSSPAILTINGGVASASFHRELFVVDSATASASKIKIRSESDNTQVSPYVTEMSAFWFSGTSIGGKINKAFQAGGTRTTCRIPAGQHVMSETIVMSETTYGSNLVLRGESQIACSLEITGGASIVGIDASGGDECLIEGVRVLESTGSRTCVGLLVGGTSLVVSNSWFSNTKYGILANSGAGMHLDGTYVEACDYGCMIASNFADYSISGMNNPASVLNYRFDRLYVFNCGASNNIDKTGLRIDGSYFEVNTSNTTGAFTVGETVTGDSSGETFEVVSSTTDRIIAKTLSGTFIFNESMTGGTSGATAQYQSINNNDIRDIQLSAFETKQSDRHGASINDCSTISINGNFAGSGTDASSTAAGCFVGDNVAQITFNGCGFFDTASSGADSYGLQVNGANSRVVATGCTFTNDQGTNQDYGIRRQAGTVQVTGSILNGNNTANTLGTVTLTGCIEV